MIRQLPIYCKSNHVLLSHHHSTCASVSEIHESVLQTVQKQFTYRQYILTDFYRRQCAEYTYILLCTIRQLSIHVMHRMYTFYIMYTYTHTIICEGAADYTSGGSFYHSDIRFTNSQMGNPAITDDRIFIFGSLSTLTFIETLSFAFSALYVRSKPLPYQSWLSHRKQS